MFRNRRSSKVLPVELYSRFRQSHPDVASGTSPPINLSTSESAQFPNPNNSIISDDRKLTIRDISGIDFQMSFASTRGTPSLYSGSTLSRDNTASAPLRVSADGTYAIQEDSISRNKTENAQPAHPKEADPAEGPWSEFLISDELSSFETIRDPCIDDVFDNWDDSLGHTSVETGQRLGVNPATFDDNQSFEDPYLDINKPKNTMQTTSPDRSSLLHKIKVPPALVRESGGNAVTYLNKGAQYSLLVEDTADLVPTLGNAFYCTTIQVAFDSESQRKQPLASWRLWDQSRGADEGHLFDGRFQAIEYLNCHNSGHPNHPDFIANIQVVHSDGFSLVWSTNRGLPRQCSIQFQLNFLSTDFSHAKGVHGSMMQLCSRTQEVSPTSLRCPISDTSVQYCRIQVFRSHGAERKTANDMATAAKRIAKLKLKLQPSMLSSGKEGLGQDTSQQHSSKTSGGKPKRIRGLGKTEEDSIRSRLKYLQSLRTQSQQYSCLDQRGEKQQDCDWYPRRRDRNEKDDLDFGGPSLVGLGNVDTSKRPACCTQHSSLVTSRHVKPDMEASWPAAGQRAHQSDGRLTCFYVRSLESEIYEPIFLFEKTAGELTQKVAVAFSVDVKTILRSIWVCDRGLKVLVEDDVVQNMKEGQGMRVTISKVRDELFEFELEF